MVHRTRELQELSLQGGLIRTHHPACRLKVQGRWHRIHWFESLSPRYTSALFIVTPLDYWVALQHRICSNVLVIAASLTIASRLLVGLYIHKGIGAGFISTTYRPIRHSRTDSWHLGALRQSSLAVSSIFHVESILAVNPRTIKHWQSIPWTGSGYNTIALGLHHWSSLALRTSYTRVFMCFCYGYWLVMTRMPLGSTFNAGVILFAVGWQLRLRLR